MFTSKSSTCPQRAMTRGRIARRAVASFTTAVLAVSLAGAVVDGAGAADTGNNRVDLRVLVLDDHSPNLVAVRTELSREGVPFTDIDLTSASRPTIDAAFLANDTQREAYYQAVVSPGPTLLSSSEVTALSTYEARYGIRQVDTYVYPSPTVGLNVPSFGGTLDGSPVTVTDAGHAGPFAYLGSGLSVDDNSPSVAEVFGYVATPLASYPAGSSFTPLLSVTAGGATGSLVGEYVHNGLDELVITAAFNADQQYFETIAHGLITWMTRGVHLGYQRNYFSVEVDDVFLADSQWSTQGDCTPGDNCFGANANLTTPDIRMTGDDVSSLVQWQNDHNFRFDMIFNGGGSDDYASEHNGNDPVLTAFQANAANFTFINHTYSHAYLGCIQVAPAVAGEQYHCATQNDENDPSTVYIDPTLVTGTGQTYDKASGFYFASAKTIDDQITENLSWAAQHNIPVDASQLVTGEHSGEYYLPQQPMDSPFLAGELTKNGITAVAADASREPDSRVIGSATTAPRHPMNIFYNASTYQDEVNEYNWIYTSAANGGSDLCTQQPQTTTCITPLPDADAAQSQQSFTTYIVPTEVHNAMADVLANDPRTFYVHQSNLTENKLVLPVVANLLTQYRASHAANTPLVHVDLTGEARALSQMAAWNAQSGQVSAYLDNTGVHLSGPGSAQVPLTVPAGTTVNGSALDSYGGELSGWITQPATDTVVANPTTASTGYVGVPEAPTGVTAVAGRQSATVSWTPPTRTNGADVTGYVVRGYVAGSPVASVTVTAPATATSQLVTGLHPYDSIAFTVSAVNAGGTGPESAQSDAVVPYAVVPAAPSAPTATPGDSSATVAWAAPDNGGLPITQYTVKAYVAGQSTYVLSATSATTGLVFGGLTNGTSYTFTVTAANGVGVGAESAPSAAIVAGLGAAAPTSVAATARSGGARVSWTAPANTGGMPITSYVIRGYTDSSTTPAATFTAAATATGANVTLLPVGVPWTFDVRAVTAAGPGAASARTMPVTPTGKPGAPTITSATASGTTATISWAAPANTGGQSITAYVVRALDAGTGRTLRTKIVAGSTTSTTLPVALGQATVFDVTAYNPSGAGPTSAQSAPLTSLTVPGAPNLSAVNGGHANTADTVVRWTAPSNTGGSPITGYVVTTYTTTAAGAVTGSSDSGSLSAGTTSLNLTLPTGYYRFSVLALNAQGSGPASRQSGAVRVR